MSSFRQKDQGTHSISLFNEESVSGVPSGRASLLRVLERVSQSLKCHSNIFGVTILHMDFTSTTYPCSHMRVQGNILCTVEPQSYGLHSYGIFGQPDAGIEYIFGKYHQTKTKHHAKLHTAIFSASKSQFS